MCEELTIPSEQNAYIYILLCSSVHSYNTVCMNILLLHMTNLLMNQIATCRVSVHLEHTYLSCFISLCSNVHEFENIRFAMGVLIPYTVYILYIIYTIHMAKIVFEQYY